MRFTTLIFLLCLLAKPVFAVSHTFYFACTAVDGSGLESVYSAEVDWVRENGGSPFVTLAWDAGAAASDQSPVISYRIHWGLFSGTYTRTEDAGTNCELTIRVVPAALTNCAVTVAGQDLEWAPMAKGPWTLLGADTWTVTNPPLPMLLFRGHGVTITRRSF